MKAIYILVILYFINFYIIIISSIISISYINSINKMINTYKPN